MFPIPGGVSRRREGGSLSPVQRVPTRAVGQVRHNAPSNVTGLTGDRGKASFDRDILRGRREYHCSLYAFPCLPLAPFSPESDQTALPGGTEHIIGLECQ